jgi:hypothetical protein
MGEFQIQLLKSGQEKSYPIEKRFKTNVTCLSFAGFTNNSKQFVKIIFFIFELTVWSNHKIKLQIERQAISYVVVSFFQPNECQVPESIVAESYINKSAQAMEIFSCKQTK